MKNTTGLVVIFLLAFTISCNEDFLQQEPLSSLNPQNTFIDAGGLQTSIDAALRAFSNQQWNRDYNDMAFNQNMSEASVVSCTDKPDAPAVDMDLYATPLNDRNNDAGRMRSFYANNYAMIKSVNTVIDNIDIPDWAGGDNDTDRNHLLGTAYFLRAFFYLQLTMDFGNVGFLLNVVSEARQDFKAFYMQGIWDQMITDLEYAVQHMKKRSQIPVGQPSVDAARLLLAKYYMLNQRFADAEALMTTVINDPESHLFTQADVDASRVTTVMVGNNYNPDNGELLDGFDCEQPADPCNLLFLNAGAQKANNPEGLWLLVNTPFVDGSQRRSQRMRCYGPNLVSTNKGIKAPPTGTVTGENIVQDLTSKQMLKWGRGQGFARPTNYAQYEIWNFKGKNDQQDYRHKRGNYLYMDMVIYDNPDLLANPATKDFYGKPLRLWYDGNLLCEDSIRCWHGYPIYKMWAPNFEDQVKRQDGGDQDIYVMREAEAYLVRAEARFWQNNNAGVAEDLNVIRQRANAIDMYTASDIQTEGIGAILDERCRELFGEEYRHDELVRMSVIFAKTGKTCYNGKTYTLDGKDIEKSLSASSFYYDRQMEKNNFFRENVPWSTYPTTKYTMSPKHIFWPVYEPYLIGNVGATLNQTTGYDGSENNIEPLTHIVQPAGKPNIDPMKALGEIE